MAISIDWANRIILVPKADLLLVQSNPTEIRELDLVNFHTTLRLLEAEYMGILYTQTHNYKGPLSVGGVTLAAVVEIINNYTILFEDGQYAVNLVNANSNVGDRVNVNQVSVRSANSAGLTNVREIEFSSFQGVVVLDTIFGTSGTAFPIGTFSKPSNNLTETMFITDLRGLGTIVFRNTLNIPSGTNISGRVFKGDNAINSSLTLEAGVITSNTIIEDTLVHTSTFSDSAYLKHTLVHNVSAFSGYMESSVISGSIGMSDRATSYFVDCKSGCVGLGSTDLPILDLSGENQHISFRNFSGPIKLTNSTHSGNTYCIDITSGATIILDSSCTAGLIYIRGVAEIVNNSNMTVIKDASLSQLLIAEKTWTDNKAVTKESINNIANLVLATS